MQCQSAPCLAQRLVAYSFREGPASIFTFAPEDDERCHHAFSVNESRTRLPPSHHILPDNATKWSVALTCQRCLGHIDAIIDFAETTFACPDDGAPFHHFLFDDSKHFSELDTYPRQYNFKCTAPRCSANLLVSARPAVLHPKEVDYLLDVEPRMEWVRSNTTLPFRNRNTLEALDVFRSYTQGCLDNLGRTISKDNPAFQTAIGDAGSSIIRRLGFDLVIDSRDADKPVWKPPQVPPHNLVDCSFDPVRSNMEDVREEITALMQSRPANEKRGHARNEYAPPPSTASYALSLVMGVHNYTKFVSPRQQRVEPLLGLGALPDFNDELISWCYDRSVLTFPVNTPFYFRCLKDAADDRQSEKLSVKAMTLESQGVRSDIDISEAWHTIGINPSHDVVLTDNNILSHFQARYQDSGADQQRSMLQALNVIADYRQSSILKNAASGTIENYEQALSFLGAEAATPDEFILSLKTAKEQEDQLNQGRAMKALQIIAKERNSNLLQAALQGDSQESKMDINHAYGILGADPKADDDTLIFAFPGLITDYPQRRTEIIQAMLTIADSRNSSDLKQQAEAAQQGQQNNSVQRSVEDPRGLENIGNTCYLNSFLQYLYTVRPLRELVETIDDHRQELSRDALAMKKVSDEHVTRAQVERAQSFVTELKGLFEELKTSRYNAVKLNKSLAALTVAPTGDWTASREQEKRRRSTLVSSKPPRVKFSEAQVNGTTAYNNDAIDVTESPLEERAPSRVISEDNPTTPLTPSTPNGKHSEDVQLTDAPQSLVDDPMDTTGESQMDESEPRLSGDTIAPSSAKTETDVTISNTEAKDQVVSIGPPPVPPRNGVDASTQFSGATKEKIEEWAQQQDMREALANVFRQLRWAMKNEGESNKEQEQVDLISRLFYGKENIVTGNTSQEKAIESIPFHALYVIPDESYENIYSMLDGAYGFRDITDETSQKPRTQFSTFSQIPPILHIDVAVTTWDKEAQHAVRRAPFKVAESFYMDRYLDQPELIEKRKDLSLLNSALIELKEKRAKLTENELGMEMPNVLRSVSAYLTGLSNQSAELELGEDTISESLIQDLDTIAELAQGELTIIDAQMDDINKQMIALFPEEGNLLYRLHAVCVHTGRAESGHYYIYISDGTQWYKYNDETVERVTDTSIVLNPTAGSTGVPAMMVYVRDSETTDLMQTVCREPVESMTQAVYQGAWYSP